MNSDILRKFLLFIVDQTLSGHANWLKEYTIGVNVLNKPANFKPQENGIVRIHAGRLRRALHHYYKETGMLDSIHISIPKGRYVPVFEENGNKLIPADLNNIDQNSAGADHGVPGDKKAVIAVIPFRHFHNDELENSLTDGIGLQLSNALLQLDKYSVIAYYTMRNLCEKVTDISEMAAITGAKYIVTGNIQSLEDRARIHIQVIHTNTGKQLWSWMHEAKFTAETIFELQDEIVKLIISELNKSQKLTNEKPKNSSMVAVA
jgi:TolB-like protein